MGAKESIRRDVGSHYNNPLYTASLGTSSLGQRHESVKQHPEILAGERRGMGVCWVGAPWGVSCSRRPAKRMPRGTELSAPAPELTSSCYVSRVSAPRGLDQAWR